MTPMRDAGMPSGPAKNGPSGSTIMKSRMLTNWTAPIRKMTVRSLGCRGMGSRCVARCRRFARRASRLKREHRHLSGLGAHRERQLVLGERQRGDRRVAHAVRRQDCSARGIQDLHRAVGATHREGLVAQEQERLDPATDDVRRRLLLTVLSPEDDLAGVVGRGEALPLRGGSHRAHRGPMMRELTPAIWAKVLLLATSKTCTCPRCWPKATLAPSSVVATTHARFDLST